MQYRERAAGHQQREAEDRQTLQLVLTRARGPSDAESEGTVGRCVQYRGDEQSGEVRGLCPDHGMQHQIQQCVGHGARDTDDAESHQLADHSVRYTGHERLPSQASTQFGDGEHSGRKSTTDAPASLQILDGGIEEVDAAVGVVDPIDRHLVNP